MAQTDQDLIDFVSRKMGAGVVGVELTADQYEDALHESKSVFQAYIGQTKVATLQGVSNGGEFDVPTDCEAVVEVSWDSQDSDLYDQFDWAGVELGPLNFGAYGGYRTDGGSGGGYSYLIQALQYREQSKRVLGIDRDWYWDHDKQKLILFPSGRGGRGIGQSAQIRYMVREVDVSKLRSREYMLLRRYMFGECLETLGYIRTKYADVPSAGGTLSLNGDTVLGNGEAIKAEVIEKLKMFRGPTGFFGA